MSNRLVNPGNQHFTSTGAPLSNGLMFFYEVDSDTPKDTYADADLQTANSNPVVLSSGGLEPNIFLDGAYRVVLTAKYLANGDPGVQQWDRDNVNVTSSIFSAWVPTITYGAGGDNIVTGSDGNYYVSLAADNLNHDPISSPEWWIQFQFLQTWNANKTYADEAIVELDGVIYSSQQGSNLNHNPGTDVGTWWIPQGSNLGNQQLFTSSGTWTKYPGTFALVELWGAGGGGGAGFNAASNETKGGGSGGGGGRYTSRLYKLSDLAATVAVTIGAGGTSATVGGNTTFGALLTAYGGAGGTNGDNTSAKAGGFPGGSLTAGNALSGTTYGTGDFTESGSQGGIGGFDAAAAGAGLRSLNGGCGGGGGGGMTALDAPSAGAAGGSQTQGGLTGGGGAGGAATSAVGSPGVGFQGGGGGGAGTSGGAGGAGGTASGGGGGGAGDNGLGAAAGGTGGNGYARITIYG